MAKLASENTTMKIGLLAGMEDTFPRAFLARLEERGIDGSSAHLITLGGTRHDHLDAYDLILDRISHEVAYYRAHLRQARLSGTRVVNDPFLVSSDDRFLDCAAAARLGVHVPRTVLLPQKAYPETVSGAALRNLAYPLPWDDHIEFVGLPALLRPVALRGWRHVVQVGSREELIAAYDRTGQELMMLQESVAWNRYVRCIVIGGDRVIPARYDPEYRQYLNDADYLEPELEERIVRDATAIASGLGYDMCAIEFAIRDEEPYAVEFVNPAPDFERSILTPFYFDKVVDALVDFCIGLATAGRDPVVLARPAGKGLVASVRGLPGAGRGGNASTKKATSQSAEAAAEAPPRPKKQTRSPDADQPTGSRAKPTRKPRKPKP